MTDREHVALSSMNDKLDRLLGFMDGENGQKGAIVRLELLEAEQMNNRRAKDRMDAWAMSLMCGAGATLLAALITAGAAVMMVLHAAPGK